MRFSILLIIVPFLVGCKSVIGKVSPEDRLYKSQPYHIGQDLMAQQDIPVKFGKAIRSKSIFTSYTIPRGSKLTVCEIYEMVVTSGFVGFVTTFPVVKYGENEVNFMNFYITGDRLPKVFCPKCTN